MTSLIKATIFDVFGTIVDWRTSIAKIATAAFTERNVDCDGFQFADYWRGQYDPAMDKIRTGKRGYVALDEIHFENLEQTLVHFSLKDTFNRQEKNYLNEGWEKLTPWSDVVDGLHKLKSQTIIAPCSNGSIALMTRLAKFGALPWDCILGADLAQNYKPHPSVYRTCCEALRLEPEEVMMVACHNNDLAAARASGLKTGFIARPTEHGPHQTIDLSAEDNWDIIAEDLNDLAEKFTAYDGH